MAPDDDNSDIEDEWQFDDDSSASFAPGAPAGGGLLQQILDEVSALRATMQSDRDGLADALNSAFGRLEGELDVLREQVTALRGELNASDTVMTNALTE